MRIDLRVDDADLLICTVIARGVRLSESPRALAAQIDDLVARRSAEDFPPPAVKEAVRAMLRRGGFKPSGRNKPASEYLAQAAREARFPRINNLVDSNNLLSLESGLPISLLDAEALGEHAEIRYGREGESYVFNPAGQAIDLKGLLCVCRVEGDQSTPLGNPIKDSMAGKLKEQTSGVVGMIYGTRAALALAAMSRLAERLGELLRIHGQAQSVDARVLGA